MIISSQRLTLLSASTVCTYLSKCCTYPTLLTSPLAVFPSEEMVRFGERKLKTIVKQLNGNYDYDDFALDRSGCYACLDF